MTLRFLVALTLLAGAVQAQSVTGKAFGTYVNVAGNVSQSPVAMLPSSGGMATGQADAVGVPGSVDAQWLNAVTTGAVACTSTSWRIPAISSRRLTIVACPA